MKLSAIISNQYLINILAYFHDIETVSILWEIRNKEILLILSISNIKETITNKKTIVIKLY